MLKFEKEEEIILKINVKTQMYLLIFKSVIPRLHLPERMFPVKIVNVLYRCTILNPQ